MKFRHRSAPSEDPAETGAPATEAAAETESTPADNEGAEAAETPTRGPRDASEVDLEGQPLVDMGSLLIAPADDLDIRVQVDEATQQVASVMLADDEGAVELRAFAAPRSGGLWDEVRPEIAAEMKRMGGTVEEAEGAFGTELRCVLPLQDPQGQQVYQPSRVFGISGPRWMLRATLLGRPAVEPEADDRWVRALDGIVVARGTEAMAPGDPLPLRLPPRAAGDPVSQEVR